MRSPNGAFDRADADDTGRAAVVTGAGERAFGAEIDRSGGPAYAPGGVQAFLDKREARFPDRVSNLPHFSP